LDGKSGKRGLQSRGYSIGNCGGYPIEGHLLGLTAQAIYEFNFSFSYASSDVDSIWDTDKVSVLEFDPGTLIAIV